MGFGFSFVSIIIVFFISFSSLLLPSHAADTLQQGQSLVDGQTLISAGNLFELGFFSPGNSTKRYVGIWYNCVPEQTVVWVANRGSPLLDSSGSLTVRWDGNLVVLDGGGNLAWSSNSSTLWNNSTAQLMDTGNFVLSTNNGSGTVLWQSFDHPTNTFIPGMTISLDQNTGRNQLFTSWRSRDDPGIGNYSLGLDPLGSAQLYIWDGLKIWWRSGQWNRQSFIGITRMRPLYLYGFQLNNDGKGTMSFSFTQFNGSLLKFVMDYDGIERTSIYAEETQSWNVIWQQPLTVCETYNTCGRNGICDNGNSSICSCLKGFEPKNFEEWNKGNWSSGCIRRTVLQCQMNNSITNGTSRDGFWKMDALKLPDFSDWASVASDATGCAVACSGNCSCIAYAYVNGIGCMTWGRDLLDVSQLSVGGNALFIKLAGSEFDSGEEGNLWIVLVVVSLIGATIFFISFFLLWKYRVQIEGWWKRRKKIGAPVSDLRSSTEVQLGLSGGVPGEEGTEGKGSELPFFHFEVLATATNNFNDSNKLGQGGFGLVYKGVLPGGEEIAVKRLSKSSGQGVEEFKNEIILIAKLQHRNLVKLLGCCIEEEEKILIYEYMPNKSLDAFLFNPPRQPLLDWKKRFSIIEGIARGLLYLHRDSRLRIVHRDLKASNILLDEEMNPKISDFGMARIFGGNQNHANTERVVGTYGYMSPEYAMEGLFSAKSDVYSFGVLILEIVSGNKNNRFRMENFPTLLKYAWKLWSDGRAMELVDPLIRNSCLVHEVLRCVHIGLLCVQDRSSDRPNMSSVVIMLESGNAINSVPKEPTFAPEVSHDESESLDFNADALSTNDVTITVLTGR